MALCEEVFVGVASEGGAGLGDPAGGRCDLGRAKQRCGDAAAAVETSRDGASRVRAGLGEKPFPRKAIRTTGSLCVAPCGD